MPSSRQRRGMWRQTVEVALMVHANASMDGEAKHATNPAAKRRMTDTCVVNHLKGFATLRKDNVSVALVYRGVNCDSKMCPNIQMD